MNNKLREYRQSAGMTQKQLAQATGISNKYISLLEKGQRRGAYPVLVKLARFFDCHVEDIFPLEVKQDTSA